MTRLKKLHGIDNLESKMLSNMGRQNLKMVHFQLFIVCMSNFVEAEIGRTYLVMIERIGVQPLEFFSTSLALCLMPLLNVHP